MAKIKFQVMLEPELIERFDEAYAKQQLNRAEFASVIISNGLSNDTPSDDTDDKHLSVNTGCVGFYS